MMEGESERSGERKKDRERGREKERLTGLGCDDNPKRLISVCVKCRLHDLSSAHSARSSSALATTSGMGKARPIKHTSPIDFGWYLENIGYCSIYFQMPQVWLLMVWHWVTLRILVTLRRSKTQCDVSDWWTFCPDTQYAFCLGYIVTYAKEVMWSTKFVLWLFVRWFVCGGCLFLSTRRAEVCSLSTFQKWPASQNGPSEAFFCLTMSCLQ